MASPTIWSWSSTAADNATADSGLTWSEGQAPSTVNDSARVMMKRVADMLKDLGGIAEAGGTANALTLTTYNSFTAYRDGLLLTFRAASANTDETTLNVNSVGTKPIVKMSAAGETVLSGGEIQTNGIYEVVYSEDLNAGVGAWLLINPSPLPISQWPTGMIGSFGGAAAPDGFLACDGAAVSRTTYASLFSAIGTKWGSGDGSTTFNVPDLEDEFLRGASNDREVGSSQADALKSHLHAAGTLVASSAGAHVHQAASGNFVTTQGGSIPGGTSGGAGWNNPSVTASGGTHTHNVAGSTASTGDTETRPRNKAALFVIKT